MNVTSLESLDNYKHRLANKDINISETTYFVLDKFFFTTG